MSETPLLQGQTAIITGAARGIGAAVAATLANAGARVVLTDILEDDLEKTAADIGDHASAMRLDVSDEAGWQQVVDDTLATMIRIASSRASCCPASK